MGKPFSILHISDLHRSPRDPISNAELVSALVSDRDRYVHEAPRITPPDAIVVSGDIIQGVPLNVANPADQLRDQYQAAEEFLDELVRRLIGGDRSKVVIVPGNHDVDWNAAFLGMTKVEKDGVPPNLNAALSQERSEYRWDWKTQTLFKITDQGQYAKRLDAYWEFFERFYRDVPNALSKLKRGDANLFSLCDGRIGVAAFNSCEGNDCFAFHGMVRRDVIGRTYLDLADSGNEFDLRMAVWHHSIEGPPYRTDYMDVDIVRGMIGRGFRLGLYGHQHKAQITPHHVWLPDKESMAVVSAGSLCAGAIELPTGVHRQYNILEVADDFKSVRVHVRAMNVANLFSRGQLPEFGGVSFADLEWEPPRNQVGGAVNVDLIRLRHTVENAEIASKGGNPAEAVKLLGQISLPPNTYERELFLDSAAQAQDWGAIAALISTPASIDEIVRLVDALLNMRNPADAKIIIDKYAAELALPAAIVSDLGRRIRAQEALSQ